MAPRAGLEPAINGLEVSYLIHQATEALSLIHLSFISNHLLLSLTYSLLENGVEWSRTEQRCWLEKDLLCYQHAGTRLMRAEDSTSLVLAKPGVSQATLVVSEIGASDGNRTRISSLEGWCNNHYTTAAQPAVTITVRPHQSRLTTLNIRHQKVGDYK